MARVISSQELFSGQPSKPKVISTSELFSNKQTDNPVESLISSRPSFIDVNNPINFKSMKRNPIGESLRALGGGFEVAEGVPADIGLGLQKATETGGKSLTQIPSDIWKTLKGERPAQYGDIYRGAGVPEPLAATGGFLSSASEFTPTGAAGTAIARGAGKLLSPIVKPIGNALKSGTAKVLHSFSGVPEQSVRTALDNPKVLSGRYIKNEVKASGQEMEKNVKPLVNDPNATIQVTPKITNLGAKLNLFTPNGQSTKVLSTMADSEKTLIGDWLQRADNGSGKISFNEADKIVGEIDSELQAYYKAKKMGQIFKNTQFDRVAKEIRVAVNEARKSQFPKAGQAIDRYSRAMKGQTANEQFSKFIPKGSPGNLTSRAAIELGLGWAHPQAAVALGVFQSPLLQAKGIQLGATAGKFLSNPNLIAQSLRKLQSK